MCMSFIINNRLKSVMDRWLLFI